jgi:pimeloyl-ACP methyl ester carboxylesterase
MPANVTQITAPNKHIEAANGVRYAYRRYGNAETSALPLVCFQHNRGNLDNWDPVLVDTLATEREVILVDNAGVAGSTGKVPSTIAGMAIDAVAFTDALGLRTYDLHRFSMGGFIAQEVALIRPHQLRRLVLTGTAPQGGRHIHGWTGEILDAAVIDALRASPSSRVTAPRYLYRRRVLGAQHRSPHRCPSLIHSRSIRSARWEPTHVPRPPGSSRGWWQP